MMAGIDPVRALPPTEAAAQRKAAQGFEALMLEKILAAARPETAGPQADAHAIAEQALAADLAKSNPFGLAQLLERKP